MSDSSDARRALTQIRWVHTDGDDTAQGAVFRDASGDLALSRRPKEYLEFGDDGTVRRLASGADDRAHEVDRTSWRTVDGQVVFRFATADSHGRHDYRIVEQSADQLVIRRQ